MFTGFEWDLLSDAVEQLAIESAESKFHRHGESISVWLPPGARALLKRAAHGRQLSMNHFASRAVMAFVCADLDLDWHEVMADERPIVVLGEDKHSGQRYGGAGFGSWVRS